MNRSIKISCAICVSLKTMMRISFLPKLFTNVACCTRDIQVIYRFDVLHGFHFISVFRYLNQFKEIFTEEGRRIVKITTQRPGQPPIVTCTQTTPPASRPEAPSNTVVSSKQNITATSVISSQVYMMFNWNRYTFKGGDSVKIILSF